MNRSEIKKIGGSDIAVLMGFSTQYRSPHSLYLHLVGESDPQPDNEVLERGRLLEPSLALMFGAMHHDEFEVKETDRVTDPEHDFLIGSPDRILCVDGLATAILEIKTADITKAGEWGEEGTDQIPEQYYCQCQWYMGLAGLSECYVFVGFVVSGSKKPCKFAEYRFDFVPAHFEFMKETAVQFWNEHVLTKNPPPVTVADNATVQYYKKKFPAHCPDNWVVNPDVLDPLAEKIIESQSALKEFEKNFEDNRMMMIAAIGACEGARTSFGDFSYRKTKDSQTIDWESLARFLGATERDIERHTKTKPGYRRFLIPSKKGKS